MLGILILFGIGSYFYKYAKKHDLNVILWPIIGLVSYFLMQAIAGVVIGVSNPNMLDDTVTITLIGLITGIVGTLVAAIVMKTISDKKAGLKAEINSDLIDDDTTFYSQKESDF